MFYKDYFKINPDFTPCMNRASIDESADRWMAFYPHESFVELLKNVLTSLDGGNQSVWLAAPYGTGKSHAALVLQKLLMDDEERVEQWLKKRKQLIPEALCNALRQQRANNVLVAFDSGSDAINSPAQFLVRIENTILRALKDKGYQIPAMGSQDAILQRIREEEANFFRKRDELQGSLCHLTGDIANVDDLEKAVKIPKLTAGLVSDIMTVLHARDIYPNLSSENLIKWVYEILEINRISKLFFIWDEFSTYIDQNRSQLKTFEEVAEAAQQGRFFFMPVTHMKLEAYLASGSESAQKANTRFHFCALDMPTNTALLLAADAFQVTNADWIKERDELWHGISSVITSYMATKDEDCQDKQENFKGILPIHPMTAFVLKFLSTLVGSNQRSMFNYLKGEAGESEFQCFIAEGGPELKGKQYLTVDYLWRYFIERNDLGTNPEVNNVRIEFSNKSKTLNDVEIRIFKAVLLYSLLGRLTSNVGHELIQPTLENIKRCFEGDAGIVGVENIAKELEKKHCFSIINGRCEMFRAAGDSVDLEKQKEKIRTQFNEQICNNKAQPRLESMVKRFKDKLHFEVRCSTQEKAAMSCQRTKELFDTRGNKVLLQFILAQDAEQQLLVQERAKDLAEQMTDFRMIFIVVPELNFCTTKQTNWEEYVDQLAHIALATDQATKTNYETQISLMDNDWLAKLCRLDQKLKVYKPNPNGEPYIEERQWNTLEDYLKKYLKECFECFIDDFSEYNTSSMKEGGGALQSWAKAGIDFSSASGMFQNACRAFAKHGISDSPEWFEQNPTHALTRMRDFCREKMNNALNGTTGTCSIRKIFIDLRRPPFGVLSVPYTAFVMGFVMREWLNNPRQQLQWTNGSLSEKLDAKTLAEMIEATIQDNGNNTIKSEKLICRISREEKKFIECAPIMFGIPRVPNANVESTLQEIAARLERVSEKAPLWVLPDYIYEQEDLQADNLSLIIGNLCEAQKISAKGDQQVKSAKVKEIGIKLQETEGLAEQFAKYIIPEIFSASFRMHIDKIRPSLKGIAESIGDATGQYGKAVKEHFAKTAGWLWNSQDVENELELIEAQYRIIAIIQEIIGQKAFMPYGNALDRVKKALYADNKISLILLAGDYPILERFLQVLDSSGIGNGMKDLADLFEGNRVLLKEIFFDPTKTVQLGVLKKHFDAQLAALGEEEIRKLYDCLSAGAKRSDDDFRQTAFREIDDYLKESTVQQLAILWKQRTGSDSPADWSKQHKMPASLLFESDSLANEIIPVLSQPGSYQANVLKKIKTKLTSISFASQETLVKYFQKRIIPQKYQAWNIDPAELCAYLSQHLSRNPDSWLQNAASLADSVEKFFRERYKTDYRAKAVERVKNLTEKDAKKLLLKFVEDNPDIGLKILE